jgi:hypothetical protein
MTRSKKKFDHGCASSQVDAFRLPSASEADIGDVVYLSTCAGYRRESRQSQGSPRSTLLKEGKTMLKRAKALVAATAVASTLTVGAMAPPAVAQQTGLVNVAIDDTNVIVAPQVVLQAQVPIGVAANVCNVNVAVLATLLDDGQERCDSTVNQRTEAAFEVIQRIIART